MLYFTASLTDKLGELDKALSDNSYSEEDDVFTTTKGQLYSRGHRSSNYFLVFIF